MSSKLTLAEMVSAIMTVRKSNVDQCRTILAEAEMRLDVLTKRREAKLDKAEQAS